MVFVHCEQLGTLELTTELGRGGMASVWKARALQHGKAFAVKLLAPYLAEVSDARARFMREAEILTRVDDEGVVKLQGRGETESGIPFVVLDALGGDSLDKVLQREKRLGLDETWITLRQVLHALDSVHRAGVSHRDVKPGNIIFERSAEGVHTTLIDFGVAHASWDVSMTDADKTVGTAHYMSPEQAFQPEIAGANADLWAAAVVAYECLTGVLPFEGATFASVCVALHAGVYTPPSRHDPSFGPDVDAFFAKAFARAPEARFQSAEEMRDAVAGLLTTSGTFAIGNAPLLKIPHRTLVSSAGYVLSLPVQTLFDRFVATMSAWFASLFHRPHEKMPALMSGQGASP